MSEIPPPDGNAAAPLLTVDEIVQQCLSVEEAQREPKLQELCVRNGRDPAMVRTKLARQLRKRRQVAPVVNGHAQPDARGPGAAPPGYVIEEELNRGGMGVVYQAWQVRLNRRVALKMIRSGEHASSEELIRFMMEAETVAGLQHPGIVTVYESGKHGGLPFIALEFCPEGSLAARLKKNPLPPRESARLVEQIARAVQCVHQMGITHRDLKPDNILLVPRGAAGGDETAAAGPRVETTRFPYDPKVTDFGLAGMLAGGSGVTQTGEVLGTPSYMAPEQARGDRNVGPAADLYALGTILYECLTGTPPFKAESNAATLLKVLHEDAVRPRVLNRQVPRDLETIVLKCLEKDARRRFASAG